MDDAAQVVLSMLGLLGGDERVQFEPWRTLTDTAGNTYYVFRQMYAGSTVLNGAVKVITDSDGNMTALSSSIETELPEVETSDGITAEEAENLVLKYAEENSMPDLTLMPEFTDKIILPVVLSVNDDGEDSESRFVWVVYSNNPKTHPNQSTELPYLAHYVDMSGNYLYSLATILPGDTAGATGFDTDYVFGFMEPAEYTGYVDLSDGTEKEITVKDLGKRLYLDSGTLTPVLKTLEKDGYITRTRSPEDERVLVVKLTKKGEQLKDQVVDIPKEIGSCVCLSEQDAKDLYRILYSILNTI